MLFSSPIYNTIIFYIFFVIIIILIKPESMYDHKTKTFKQFGFEKGQTFFSFPVMCIVMAIVLYLIFLTMDIVNKLISSVPATSPAR